MDPLTIGSSVSALVITTGKVVKKLHDLHGTIQDAPLLLSSIVSECTLVYASLGVIQDTQTRRGIEAQGLHSEQVFNAFEVALSGCALIISVLEKDVQACLVAGKNPLDAGAVRRCKLVLEKDHLQELVLQLRGQQQALALLLNSLQSRSLDVIQTNIQENRDLLHGIARRARKLYLDSERSSSVWSRSMEGYASTLEEDSIASTTKFDFDADLIASRTYRRALGYLQKLGDRQAELGKSTSTNKARAEIVAVEAAAEEISSFERLTITDDSSTIRGSLCAQETSCSASQQFLTVPRTPLSRPTSAPPLPEKAQKSEFFRRIDPRGFFDGQKSDSNLVAGHELSDAVSLRSSSTYKPANVRLSLPSSIRFRQARHQVSRPGSVIIPEGKRSISHVSDSVVPGNPSEKPGRVVGPGQSNSSDAKETAQHSQSRTKPKRHTFDFLSAAFDDLWALPYVQGLYRTAGVPMKKVVFFGHNCAELTYAIARAQLGPKSDDFFSQFPEHPFRPLASEEHYVQVELNTTRLQLALFDTAGQEKYLSLRSTLYSGTDVIVVCFFIDDPCSAYEWASKSDMPQGPPIILVGCESDLCKESDIIARPYRAESSLDSYQKGLSVARDLNAAVYVECSRRSPESISNLLEAVTKCCVLQDAAKAGAKADAKADVKRKHGLFGFRGGQRKAANHVLSDRTTSRFSIIAAGEA